MTGREIQDLRHQLGESVEQFAKRFGDGNGHHVSPRTVVAWECESRNPGHLATAVLLYLQGKQPCPVCKAK